MSNTTNIDGEQLRKQREREKLTRDELAQRAGVSAGYLRFIEGGLRAPDRTIQKVAAALQAS